MKAVASALKNGLLEWVEKNFLQTGSEEIYVLYRITIWLL